ncbi:MAG: hypothetical protein JNM10_10780 [Planctomycetia bacterium]|nr:hypothetical protein [Planctomycetia bacterium]
MRVAARVGLVVVGIAMAVYGVASLTGGWLGTPPWWEKRESRGELLARRIDRSVFWVENWWDGHFDPVEPTRAEEALVERQLRPEARAFIVGDDPVAGERFAGAFGYTLRPARRWFSGVIVWIGFAMAVVGTSARAGTRRGCRVAFGVVGGGLVLCGAAALTGGWLGTPPWWVQDDALFGRWAPSGPVPRIRPPADTPANEGIGFAVSAVGAALLTWGGRRQSGHGVAGPLVRAALAAVGIVAVLQSLVWRPHGLAHDFMGHPYAQSSSPSRRWYAERLALPALVGVAGVAVMLAAWWPRRGAPRAT